MDFGDVIQQTYNSLGISESDETDISEKLSHISHRKKTHFTSTISNERGEELLYNGKKISEFTKNPDI